MNVFVVREIKDAFETVKDLEKIGVKSKSLPITKCNYKTIPNYKIKYENIERFAQLTSASLSSVSLSRIPSLSGLSMRATPTSSPAPQEPCRTRNSR